MRWLGVVVYHESSYADLPGLSCIARTEGEVCSMDFARGDFETVDAASFSDNASHADEAIELGRRMVVEEGMEEVVVFDTTRGERGEMARLVSDGEGGCRSL